MSNFIVLGPLNRRSAICGTVFRDVCDGVVADARYFNICALFSPRRLLYHALTHRRIRRATRRFPRLRAALNRVANRALAGSQSLRTGKLDALLSKEGASCLIFVPGTRLWLLPAAAIDALRKTHPQCRLLFYLVDTVERAAQINRTSVDDVLAYLSHFDCACTYNRLDAVAYPQLLRFIDIPLWRASVRAGAPSSDLYFCGRDKMRGELLLAIHRRLTAAGMRFRLEITGCASVDYSHPDVSHRSWVPYDQYLREAMSANCLLEILSSSNTESTLRYKEAVVYNKKLLTTNEKIVSLPYYDARWMRVFHSAEDIDLDWLRAVEPVDYGYRGDFSVDVFLDRVRALKL